MSRGHVRMTLLCSPTRKTALQILLHISQQPRDWRFDWMCKSAHKPSILDGRSVGVSNGHVTLTSIRYIVRLLP